MIVTVAFSSLRWCLRSTSSKRTSDDAVCMDRVPKGVAHANFNRESAVARSTS